MLRTDYTNDILDTSKNTERVYNIKNASGEIINAGIKIEDITEYTQEGSKFGANDINATNEAINELDKNMNASYSDSSKTLQNAITSWANINAPSNGSAQVLGRLDCLDGVYYISSYIDEQKNAFGTVAQWTAGQGNTINANFNVLGGASTVISPFKREIKSISGGDWYGSLPIGRQTYKDFVVGNIGANKKNVIVCCTQCILWSDEQAGELTFNGIRYDESNGNIIVNVYSLPSTGTFRACYWTAYYYD